MRKAVVVAPAVIVMVSSVRGNKFLDKFLQILDQTRFIFHGCQSGGRAWNKNRYLPAIDLFFFELRPNLGSDVYNVAETGSLLRKLFGVNLDHAINQASGSAGNRP